MGDRQAPSEKKGNAFPHMSIKRVECDSTMAGLTLIELLIGLAIASIMSVAIFSFMAALYHNESQTYYLSQRVNKALIMKAALNNTASSAGSIAAPTLSTANGSTGKNGSTPFNLFGAIGNFLYGNCPDTGIFGNIYNYLNNTAGNFLDDLFFGGYNSAHTTATDGNDHLTEVSVPTNPIAVTASTISFYWLTAHVNGGDELCHGTLQIQGNILNYTIHGSAQNNHSNCGSPTRSNQQSTDFPVGNGWSFSGPVPDANCLGSAFPGTTPQAVVATDVSAHGMDPTEVMVCLPAL